MPLLLFVLLIVLIAQIGFWDTLAAVLGAVAMIILFIVLAIGAVVVGGYLLVRRAGRRT